MAQEFTIKNEVIESKINQLLPSQGGFGAGVDFSASTMIIPIVDVTESAEGSILRQDLQSAYSLASNTTSTVTNAATTIINTTGYYKISGTVRITSGTGAASIQVTDGFTTKDLFRVAAASGFNRNEPFELMVFLPAGASCVANSTATTMQISVTHRQIADVSGNLVNPQ